MMLSSFAGQPTRPTIPGPFLRALFGIFLLIAGASAQAVDWLKPFKIFGSEEELVLWQGPGQYLKLVEQDRFKKYQRAPGGDHPANISAKDFAAVLASLSVGKEGGSTKGGAPLFTPAEIALIAPKVADALSKAQARQDVIFAVTDAHGKSERMTTAARVFVDQGQLNIILGDTMQSGGGGADQAINHHLAPYRPGRRRESLDTAQEMGGGPGISFRPGLRSPRYDWAIVDVQTAVAAYRGPQIPLVTAPEAAPAGVPDETARLMQERQQMREEMARMRKQLEDQPAAGIAPATSSVPQGDGRPTAPAGAIPEGTRSAAPSPAPAETRAAAAAPPPAATAAKPATGTESVEQRLSVLQSLHSKKLITDEEYAAKRKKILEEL